MLRLSRFELLAPRTIEEAVEALALEGSLAVAGGTDLLPNLKHGLAEPPRLVSLHAIEALRTLAIDEGARELVIGCGTRLARVARDPIVVRSFPSLAAAAASVASPQIRNSATLGGNLHLDTRCRYVNQTELWREAAGPCLKAGGDVCHVVPGGQKCVAALSSDCAPVLVSLDARLRLVGPDGTREVALAEHYRADGLAHTARGAREIATEVRVPLPDGPRRCAYIKWRPRGSIDFPLVSVALRFDLDGDEGPIARARSVAGVLGAKPREVALPQVEGMRLSDGAVATLVSEEVHRRCRPLANVPYDADYRRHLLLVLTRRAMERLAGPA